MLKPTIVVLLGLIASARGSMEGFILGGEYAKIVNHAHSAFIHIDCVSKEHYLLGSWSCGASIINQKFLLTAAHCLSDCGKPSRIKIHVGSENLRKGQIYDCNRFAIHFDYDPQSVTNDISLVQVQSPLTLSRNSSRVALTRRHMHEETATVAGWGRFDVSKILVL
ncbi:Trypsin-like serine proteinase [Operophtera brumata]|uniref:Trypsin-like serine proteinase n=1 Tax=Operophtera brumata TaxID=104452 RepID=A0A0L7LG02_OPEBR|nr:Trypsin-like serine proteinase [Operophtera brumata]